METSLHVFTECWWAKSFWGSLNIDCGFLEIKWLNTSDWVWHCINHLGPDDLVLYSYGVSAIWYNRNLICHDREGLEIISACISTRALAHQFILPGFKFSISDLEGGLIGKLQRSLLLR
ncbi:hypothetical protein QQ045_022374 [Rhodiola kirilowii]